MKTAVNTKKGVLVKFYPNFEMVRVGVVEVETEDDNLKKYRELINADMIDIARFDDEFDIVVDDEGLLVEGNPVFDIQTQYGRIQLAGNLLFLKKEIDEDGVSLVGMETEEAFELMTKLEGKMNVIGVTRGL
ncbi:DUF3846 domain-containing protein [Gracilibacillus thailandensis]|uniref:DUF3846 domain-containing protein n=1 Tax=Gracilibacillus thailandensis TaxID=563735 RepID=A0A6N7QVZ8_9BACI|nr:hypothetical protein [Gracilibacillus thailandensis]MRI66188.1 hypothetical protein [Gracilibacillus thailandensis]